MIPECRFQEAAKSDGDAEEVANLRQAISLRETNGDGKVDMGETFLGTIFGDVKSHVFFLHPIVFCYYFHGWECWFCVFCHGAVRKSGSNDVCPTTTSCLDLGFFGAFVGSLETQDMGAATEAFNFCR